VNPRAASGGGAWSNAPLLFRQTQNASHNCFPEFFGLFCNFQIV
jgi:hypothetical protein